MERNTPQSTPCRSHVAVRAGRDLFHLAIPRGRQRAVSRHGLRFFLNYHDAPDKRVVKDGVWEPRQIRYFFDQAQRMGCEILLDVGAYFGYYSLLAAQLDRFSQIHAVEASPANHRRLLRHIRANGFESKIVPHLAAVSDSKRSMFLNGAGCGATLRDEGGAAVEAKPLDSLFAFRGETLAIKMDIEDHEIAALRGAKKLLAENRVFLQAEVHEEQTATIDYLQNDGWRLLRYIRRDFYFRRP